MTMALVAPPLRPRAISIILQQPLDVIEFDLRAGGIGEAAAQFFEDAAHPLHVDLAGDLDREVVAEFAPVQRPSQRIALIAAALLPAGAIAGAVALAVAIALLHRFRKALGALAQRLQRLALRVHRPIGVTLAQPAAGIAHRAVGLAEAVLAVAIVSLFVLLALLTLLAALALLALLALSQAALGKLLLQLLQPVAQALLVLLQGAHALVALLLAARPVAPRILALLEGLVAQLLLLADHVAEFVER